MFFFAQRGIKIIHTWSTAFQKIKPIVMFAVCFKEVWGVKKLNQHELKELRISRK